LTNDSWRVETYIKIKSKNRYLYRTVDSIGNTTDFWVSEIEIRNPQKSSSRKLCVPVIIKYPELSQLINIIHMKSFLMSLSIAAISHVKLNIDRFNISII
jgi:hypothetical protein